MIDKSNIDDLYVYEVTYVFKGLHEGTYETAMARFETHLDWLHEAGYRLHVLHWVATENKSGNVTKVVARFSASTERLIGWHACRARLPVSGVQRIGPANQYDRVFDAYPEDETSSSGMEVVNDLGQGGPRLL